MINKENIEQDIKKYGCCDLGNGLYLLSERNMSANQAGWDDVDPRKNIDFSKHEFWLTADDGQVPEGFDSIDALYHCLKSAGVRS
jgi:hypothetical protein